MRTRLLISRMCRLVETAGTSGDGKALAEEYASAVVKANSRLESVIAAADAKSIGDAIRLISEDPPLLEEVSTLDFFQLQDWESLCDMNGWKIPPRIDKQMMERAVEIGETKDAIAPFLAMYKKAVRVNNVRLAVKSLRRLVDLDHSQDWSSNLKQSERQLQTLIIEEFGAAKRDGLDEVCDRLAQELLDGIWKDGLTVKGVEDVKAYREQQEASRRDLEGRENIAILKKCLEGKWDRKLAFSLIQAIDGFVEKKWTIPDADRETVDACRARCAREFEQEELDKRWREINEKLHAAIQKEDCAAIRDALSVPEFLDRDPIDGMLGQAQGILDHAEAARRRKTFQLVAFSFLTVLAVLGVSGWWLKQKLFAGRCEDESIKLAYLEKQAKERPRYAIEGMALCLAKLKKDDTEVYNHPKVNQFETRLKAIVSENNSRTNQLVAALQDLEEMHAAGWTNGVELASVTGRIGRVEALLAKDDDTYRSRLLTVKNGWLDAVEKHEAECRDRASKFQATLVSHLGVISERLTKELARIDLRREVSNCQASLAEWKAIHSKYAEVLEAKLADAEKVFNEALEEQRSYTNALEKLVVAKDADSLLVARKDLVESFGNYPEIKALKPLEITIPEVRDALSPEPTAVKTYLAQIKGGISQEDFDNFIKENVLVIADTPEYYSLYGLIGKNDPSGKIGAISKGKPEIEKPSYETSWKITCDNGKLVSFAKKSEVESMKSRDGANAVLMPSSDEMKTVVEIANRSNLSVGVFESEILKLIKKHIAKGHENGFVANEEKYAKYYNPIRGWMSPFRRVQFLAWYMRWLKDELKAMPNVKELTRWYDELDRLATTMNVDGVDDSLSWICIWDERVRRRTVECAKLLNKIPPDWVDRYRTIKASRKEFACIEGWKVMYAGKVKFDPLDPSYESDPAAICVSVPGVATDHPLYVLRKDKGKVTLVRAFEPGKNSPWRRCAEMERTKAGYVLGEPLYHVFAKGKFIDVQEELSEMAKRAGIGKSDSQLVNIPLFSNGGQ